MNGCKMEVNESEWRWMDVRINVFDEITFLMNACMNGYELEVNESKLKWMKVGRLQEQRTPRSAVLRDFDIFATDWQTDQLRDRHDFF